MNSRTRKHGQLVYATSQELSTGAVMKFSEVLSSQNRLFPSVSTSKTTSQITRYKQEAYSFEVDQGRGAKSIERCTDRGRDGIKQRASYRNGSRSRSSNRRWSCRCQSGVRQGHRD